MLLGSAIRHARVRTGLSIAAVARLALFSSSALQRVETQGRRLDIDEVVRLDGVLGAHGELEALYASLRDGHEPPSHSVQRSTTEASHRWPAAWAGIVWIMVKVPNAPEGVTQVRLRWGPWEIDSAVRQSTIFETFKARDDVSVPIRVRTSRTTDIWFGAGQPPESWHAREDIRDRWVHADR
ncbi:helix-turn-helix domain-containing protein [Clavibacter sp. Sh2088]|uniref:helix-turn-helix domain-containing protein n=1 Tax=Clavibacter sp. Sh2088 TaxID=3397676 RepID=UPI0039E0A44B